MPKFLIATCAILALAACNTQPKSVLAENLEVHAEGPAIWKMEDKDTTLYLFGYAPVLKKGSQWQTETITNAFDAANLVLIEADNTSTEAQKEVQALIPTLGLNTDGNTLTSVLNEEERTLVGTVSASLGAPLQALDSLKPWLASVQLGVLALSKGEYDLTNTPAASIVSRAAETGKTVETLEDPTHVLEIMATFAPDEQVGLLVHTARTLRDDPQQQSKLASDWLKGDVEAIGNILHGTEGTWSSEVIYEAMLVDRNTAWAEYITRLMTTHEGSVFVAVGFGHLAGEDSLVNMLSDAGYTVNRQ